MKLHRISRFLFALAAITVVITYRESKAQSPNNDLLAFYSFNGNANDESGHGHNGIVHGAMLVDDQFETTNSAYSFVAPKSYLQINHFSSSNFDSNFTINLVTRFSSFNTDFPQLIESSNLFLAFSVMGPIYNSNPVNGNGYGHVQFYLDKNADHSESSHIGRVISKTVFQTNRFYVITVRRLDNIVSMFVNGAFESASLPITNRVLDGDVLTLGGSMFARGGQDLSFKGSLDEIRIYNRALSDTEIQRLYEIESRLRPSLSIAPGQKSLISLFVLRGNKYQLQVSTDLNRWTDSGTPFVADAFKITKNFSIRESMQFFRLIEAP